MKTDLLSELNNMLYWFSEPINAKEAITYGYFKENWKIGAGDIDPKVVRQGCLNRLIKDGNVAKTEIIKHFEDEFIGKEEGFIITLDGLLFVKKGGYPAHLKSLKYQTTVKNLKEWLLIVFAFLAGIGSIALCVIELLKHYAWQCN